MNIIKIYKKMNSEEYISKLKKVFIANFLRESQEFASKKFQSYISEIGCDEMLKKIVTKYLSNKIINPEENKKNELWLKNKIKAVIKNKGKKYFLLMLLCKVPINEIEKEMKHKSSPTVINFNKTDGEIIIKGEDIKNKHDIRIKSDDLGEIRISSRQEDPYFPYGNKNIISTKYNRKNKKGIVWVTNLDYRYNYSSKKESHDKKVILDSIIINKKNIGIFLQVNTFRRYRRYYKNGSYYVGILIKKDKNNKLTTKLSWPIDFDEFLNIVINGGKK